jgi:hypothetical protein
MLGNLNEALIDCNNVPIIRRYITADLDGTLPKVGTAKTLEGYPLGRTLGKSSV